MSRHNIVAVENDLKSIKQALEDHGIPTVDMTRGADAACIVISGMSQNFLGVQDIERDVPVVVAKGRTTNEIVDDVKKYMH